MTNFVAAQMPLTVLAWDQIDWRVWTPQQAARTVAVLPLAATEQHGPHLPFSTDADIARAYLAQVKDAISGQAGGAQGNKQDAAQDKAKQIAPATAVFLPVQDVGISTEHMAYRGTRTITPHDALTEWAQWGARVAEKNIRKIVLITSHGGNSAAMELVALDLRARLSMLAVTTSWARFGTPDGLFDADELRHGIHGGALETSIMLAARPDLVRTDKLANFIPLTRALSASNRWLNAFRPAAFAWMAQDLHPSGAMGDARQASAEKGRAVLAHGARGFCELLHEMMAFDLANLRDGPAYQD